MCNLLGIKPYFATSISDNRFMRKNLLLVFTFLIAVSTPAFGQATQEAEEDPFINDPFFSKPISELIGSNNDKPDTTSVVQRDTEDYQPEHKSQSKRYFRRVNNEGLDFGGAFESGPYASSGLYSQYPTLPMVHFNRVNGLFLGIKKERMQWFNYDGFLGIGNIHPHGMIGYSFGQEEWQYEGGIEKHFGRERRILVGAEIYNATSTDDYWRVGMLETSVTSFFAGYDYLDYFKQEGWGAYFLGRSYHFLEGGVSYNENTYRTLESMTDYHMFGKENHYRDNPPVDYRFGNPVDEIDITTLTFSGSFNPKMLMLTRYFTFAATAGVEISNPDFAISDYTYRKYTAELQAYFNFEPGSLLKYRLKAGSITGDAPLMKEFQLGGPGSMRAFPYKSMPVGDLSGNKMILSTAELQFGSSYGSGDWLDLDDFYISLFLDSGWINNHAGTNKKPGDGFEDFEVAKFEHNGGVGLGTNSIRAELAWDLRHTSRSPILWFRFNPTF